MFQAIYVNLPPVPPPSARDKNKVPPPRPAKSSTLLQNQNQQQQPISPNGYRNPNSPQFPIQLQQHHFTNTDGGYVGLALHATPAQQRSPHHQQNLVVGGGDNNISPIQPGLAYHQQSNHHSPSLSSSPSFSYRPGKMDSSSSPLNSLSSASSGSRRHVLDSQLNMTTSTGYHHHQQPLTPTSPHTPLTPKTPTHAFMHTPPLSVTPPLNTQHHHMHQQSLHPEVEEIIEYSDVADSIRRYDLTKSNSDTIDSHKSHNSASSSSPAHSNSHHHQSHLHNASKISINRLMSPSNENLLKNDHKFQKLSPEKYDNLVGNAQNQQAGVSGGPKDRNVQEHADDIELYVDPCDYKELKEIGLPMAEIKEMNAKMKQEQKDEVRVVEFSISFLLTSIGFCCFTAVSSSFAGNGSP